MTANAHQISNANGVNSQDFHEPQKTSNEGAYFSLAEVADCLEAQVLTGQDSLHLLVKSACCSDLMSDILAFVHEGSLILTGIANVQVIRTAQMLDLRCIVFVRGKQPGEDVIALARELGIVLLSVNKTMFTSAGLLYRCGLRGSPMKWASREGSGQVL